jgi:hypothetical protein
MGRGKRSKLWRTVLEEEKGKELRKVAKEENLGKWRTKGLMMRARWKVSDVIISRFTWFLPAELKSCMQSFGGGEIGVSKGSPQEDRLRTQPYLCILSIFQYYLLTFRVQLDRQILSIQKRAVKYLYSNY